MSLAGLSTGSLTLNNLRSTTFTPDGSGGYVETMSASNTPLATSGPVSGRAILGQGTGTVVSALGALQIHAGGIINAPSDLVAQALQFVSHGGASFTGANQFGAVAASYNYGSGDVSIYNSASPFTISGLGNGGGNLFVDNVGGIIVTGAMSAAGVLGLTAHSPITINNGASVTAGGNLSLIASSSGASSTTDILTIAGAVSSTGGNIDLTGGSGIGFAATASVAAPLGSVAAASPFGPVTVAPGAQLSAANGVTLTSFAATAPVEVVPPTTPIEGILASDSISQRLTADLDHSQWQSSHVTITVPEIKKDDKDPNDTFGSEDNVAGKGKTRKLAVCI